MDRKFVSKYYRSKWYAWLVITLVIGLLLPMQINTPISAKGEATQGRTAYELTSKDGDATPTTITAPSYDDFILEIGVEWIENYDYASDLPATEPDALGLYNRLGGCGWTRRFAWGNNSAWEQDWKGYNKPGGGKDYQWIDAVDMAYFAGHGSSTQFYFNSNVDDRYLHYSDCRLDWGNGDADWIGIGACNILDDSHYSDWAWCMNGLRLLMSFKTTMADVPHGNYFGWYICNGYNMTQAWFRAADALQPQGKIARILAEEYYQFWDRPSAHDDSFTMDYATYFIWTHSVGSELARPVNIAALEGTMPIFFTSELSLAEAETKWGNLGTAFGVTTTMQSAMFVNHDAPVWVSGDSQLEMDPSQGLYAYTELDSLWAEPATFQTNAAVDTVQLSAQDAKVIADEFLNANGLMPGDAQFYEVIPDTMGQQADTPYSSELSADQLLDFRSYLLAGGLLTHLDLYRAGAEFHPGAAAG